MIVRLLGAAQDDLEKSVRHYNAECPGLGYEFADEVYRSIDRISANPKAWAKVSKQTRRCVTRRFPYGIVYRLSEDEILIVAVMHMHRHPDSWRRRLT